MTNRMSLAVGLAAIVIGLLTISAVFVVRADAPEPAEVNTSADADELLAQSVERAETSDFEANLIVYNTTGQTNKVTYRYFWKISNKKQKLLSGRVKSNGSHELTKYVVNGAIWAGNGEGKWQISSHYVWDTNIPTFVESNKFRGVNATVRERTEDEIVVEVPNSCSLSPYKCGAENRTWRGVFRIDTRTGNLTKAELFSTGDGEQMLERYTYEYGISVERPDGISASYREIIHRFFTPDGILKGGLIAGVLFTLAGCLELYREYPLHRRLR